MPDVYRPQKKRRRTVALMMAGVGIFIGSYFPANILLLTSFQSEEKGGLGKLALPVSMVVSALVLALVSSRASTIRRGIIGGIILGFLGGAGCLAGIGGAMMMRMNAAISVEYQASQKDKAPDTAQTIEDAEPAVPDSLDTPDTAPADPAAEKTGPPKDPEPLDPELMKKVQEYKQRFTTEMGRLVGICLLPNIMMGALIGGMFAKAGIRRRQLYG